MARDGTKPLESTFYTAYHENEEVRHMKILKLVAAAIGVLMAAAIVIPLVVLAGLFIWLKLTEESDEEALELEQEQGAVAPAP